MRSVPNKQCKIMITTMEAERCNTIVNFSNQAHGACFRPYKAFLSYTFPPDYKKLLVEVSYKLLAYHHLRIVVILATRAKGYE